MITAGIETITPEMASEYFRNALDRNRRVSDKHVAIIAKAILDKEWVINGEGIIFDVNGRLIDGQHRLLACIKANRPIVTIVVRGIEETALAFETVDSGKKRSLSDVMSILNVNNPAQMANALTALNAIQLHQNGIRPITIIDSQLTSCTIRKAVELYENNQDMVKIVDIVRGYRFGSIVSAGVVGALWYYTSKAHPEEANKFWRAFCGDSMFRVTEADAIRDRLIMARKGNSNVKTSYRIALLVLAWNAYITKTPIQNKIFSSASSKTTIPPIM